VASKGFGARLARLPLIVFNSAPMFQVVPPPDRSADRKIHGIFAFPLPRRLLAAIRVAVPVDGVA